MKTTKTRLRNNISKSILSGPLSTIEPSIPANTCCGMLLRGNNGQIFESIKIGNDCFWKIKE